MRYAAVVLIVALATGGMILPGGDAPAPAPDVGFAEPAVSVCPVQEGSGRSTEVIVLSDVDGRTRLTLFGGGGRVGSLATRTGPSGSTVIPVGDIAAVGSVGGLVELPTARSSSGVVIGGAASLLAESCPSTPDTQTLISGGSTVSGETFALRIMNPYAGEAIVSLQVVSEAGVESNDRFDSIVIPPRSSSILDFNALIPGRQRLSVALDTARGRVISVGHQDTEGDAAIWNSVPGSGDWFLPIPEGGLSRTLILSTSSAIAVDYQIDLYGEQGVEEALITGTLDARGSVEVSLDEFATGTSAVRVIATGEVVPTLRVTDEGDLAVTTGASTQATRWLLPGASAPLEGRASVVILNASIDTSIVSLRSLRDDSVVRQLEVPADSVIEVGLTRADGYVVDSSLPVVVLWMAHTGAGATAAVGIPFADG